MMALQATVNAAMAVSKKESVDNEKVFAGGASMGIDVMFGEQEPARVS
jgi:hypothetical protein